MGPTKLGLYIEIAGCPTVCRHCWARGRPYGTMPLGDVAWVLDSVHRFCDANGLAFDACPMHELAAHPDAAEVARLIKEHGADEGVGGFEPLSTTGVPIALRDDWSELLGALRALGTRTLWLAFHGLGAEHDRQVNRPGAFAGSLLAVERAHVAGLRAGCNVFVTRTNVSQADDLIETLQRAGIDGMFWSAAGYTATPRGRRYEAVRPELGDLLPIAERVAAVSAWPGRWRDPADYTEAAWVRRALAGAWPEQPREDTGTIPLVCRPDLDVHTGSAGLYRARHGNLRTDGAEAVLHRALARGPVAHEALWFDLAAVPTVAELAARFGDAASHRVHFFPNSVRNCWLDRAARAERGEAPR